jgi:tRNA dimethylallyltransferase
MRLSDASDVAEIGVVCGPTAAGKSAIAMWLAERQGMTIISADSRQIYRGFDIGTAKPSAAMQTQVPHFGIDVVDPTERYSAAAWAASAEVWIDESRRAARTPIVVGGTGLYIQAMFSGLFAEPPLDPARRTALGEVLARMSVDELRAWTRSLDPARAHLGRTQLLRSIEIALLTGRRLTDLHRERARPARWQARYLLVDPGPALGQRIDRRIEEMLEEGWADEVQRLMQTVPAHAPAWKSTGYDAVRRLTGGAISRRAAHEEILIATRQYAKRQRTWFRHQLPGDRVTVVNPLSQDWQAVVSSWSEPRETPA